MNGGEDVKSMAGFGNRVHITNWEPDRGGSTVNSSKGSSHCVGPCVATSEVNLIGDVCFSAGLFNNAVDIGTSDGAVGEAESFSHTEIVHSLCRKAGRRVIVVIDVGSDKDIWLHFPGNGSGSHASDFFVRGDGVKNSNVFERFFGKKLCKLCNHEAGCVGGEEDGHDTSGLPAEKLYTTPEDMMQVYETLSPIGRFMFAATFGNVHGAYKPGAVKLKPTILRDGQKVVMDKYGEEAEMDLVFHGGSGTSPQDLQETLDYGVIKMNIDTDTQYAFSRPIVTHMCENIEGVLKIDGEVGNKKCYDPRSYLKKAEQSLCDRMKQACDELRSSGNSIYSA